MSAVITADIHLADNPRDEYRHVFMKKTLPGILKKEKPSVLLVLGDLTEEKDRFSSYLVNRTVAYFKTLAELCPVVIMTGNHDYVSEGHPFFEFLKHIPGITWVNTPQASDEVPGTEDLKAVFLPHTHDHERDWGEINFKKYDWAFAHNTFTNADVGHGRKLDGIPLSFFPKNLQIVAGDIHVPQTIGKLTYVGSPYLVDFGDDFDPRILRLDKKGLTSIPCPGVQKRLLEISKPEDIVKLLRKSEVFEGDIVKVRIKPQDNEAWTETQQAVRKFCQENHLVPHVVQPTKEAAEKRRFEAKRANTHRSDEELLKQYGATTGIKPQLLKVGLELLGKV